MLLEGTAGVAMLSPSAFDMNFVFSVLPVITGAVQMASTLSGRLRWSSRAHREIGPFGALFSFADQWVQGCLSVLVFVFVFLGGWALVQGAVANDTLSFLDDYVGGTGLFANSVWIALGGFVLTFIVHYDLIPKSLLLIARIRPSVTFTPAWTSAHRHVRDGCDAVAINVDVEQCRVLASRLLESWRARAGPEPDAAVVPDLGSLAERANFLFVECLVEGQLGAVGGLPEKLRDLFLALKAADTAEPGFFAPASLRRCDRRGFYARLRQAAPNTLADNDLVATEVARALDHITTRYDGDARNLARWWKHWSASRVLKRLTEIPGFAGPGRQAIRTQFLKLSVDAGVFPKMNPGSLVIPFNRGMTKLLFDSGCILIPPNVDNVRLDEDVRRIVAYAEGVLADEVLRIGASGGALRRRDGSTLSLVTASRREIQVEVDFLLFAEVRRLAQRASAWRIPDTWSIQGRWLKRA